MHVCVRFGKYFIIIAIHSLTVHLLILLAHCFFFSLASFVYAEKLIKCIINNIRRTVSVNYGDWRLFYHAFFVMKNITSA